MIETKSISLDVDKIRKDFPIFANNPGLVFLDNASTTQKPQSVIDTLNHYYENYNSNIHRGIYQIAEKATAAYEETRKKAAHFIGAEEGMFLANIDHIEKCINNKTVAIMIPNLLGNICDWKSIYKIGKKFNLKIVEDSADTIGYRVNNKSLGKYSDVSTNSFYASHIITGAGTGGIVCFNNFQQYNKAKLLRGWGRSSATFNESENANKRFNIKISGIDYDAKYVFSEMGYNFLPLELSAAFAIEQIKKLKKNINLRTKNFNYLKNFFSKYKNLFKLPEQNKGVKTAWLAFPLVIKKNNYFSRKELQIFFEKNNIQTRTIFTGNILKQPIMKGRIYKKTNNINKISDDVMRNGILIGCHQGMKKKELIYICHTFKRFIYEI